MGYVRWDMFDIWTKSSEQQRCCTGRTGRTDLCTNLHNLNYLLLCTTATVSWFPEAVKIVFFAQIPFPTKIYAICFVFMICNIWNSHTPQNPRLFFLLVCQTAEKQLPPQGTSVLHHTQGAASSLWQCRSTMPLSGTDKVNRHRLPSWRWTRIPRPPAIRWGSLGCICAGGGPDSCAGTAGLDVLAALPPPARSWTCLHAISAFSCYSVAHFVRKLPSAVHCSVTSV